MAEIYAAKRLRSEYKELIQQRTEGILVWPVREENFFLWRATIKGPAGTCYEGGAFNVKLFFPRDYPMNPPKMRFTSRMFHPNVYRNGQVCISILHKPGDDPQGYELSAERWTPVQGVEKILLSVISLLAEPNCENPVRPFAANLWRNDRERFNRKVQEIVQGNQ